MAQMIDIGKKLGRRTAELRQTAGLTQLELAKAVGTSPMVISRLERGESIPSIGRMAEIAAALDVPIADLFEFAAPRKQLDEKEAATRRLVALIRRRSADDIDLLLRIAHELFAGKAPR